MKILVNVLTVMLSAMFISPMTIASEQNMSFGIYANIVGGGGNPSNDVLGLGFIGSYQLKSTWFIDVEYINSEADFERPWKVLGLVQDEITSETVDAVYTSDKIMIHARQNIKSNSAAFDWYWSVGIGFNSLNFDDTAGPLEGGGIFNIITSSSTETIMGIKGGIKTHLSDNWDLNFSLRYDYHLADWDVIDTVTNTSGKIDNYSLYGALIGVERRF